MRSVATSDVHSISEIPATDEIHMPELSRTVAYTTR